MTLRALGLALVTTFAPVEVALGAQTPATPVAVVADVPAVVTAEQAAPFLGNWVATFDGPQGAFVLNIAVKSEGGKVTAETSSDMQPKTAVDTITKNGNALSLKYMVDFQRPVPVVLTLTPDADKVKVDLSFGGGQFQMAGVGTKAKL